MTTEANTVAKAQLLEVRRCHTIANRVHYSEFYSVVYGIMIILSAVLIIWVSGSIGIYNAA